MGDNERFKVGDIEYVYDYALDKPVKKSEMTREQFEASEKAKWEQLKEQSDD